MQDRADMNPDHLEIMTEFINLFCLSVLAAALGSKTTTKRLRPVNYGRTLVILVYFFSWAFAATAVLVISTNYKNYVSCTVGMLACDIFYAGSKIVCYLWLIERVHLVSTSTLHLRRIESWQYRFHIVLLFPYVAIAALMLTFRNIIILPNGQCLIGLKLPASGPLIVYDFCFNLYLTVLFVIPLIRVSRRSRAEWTRTRLYNLSIRSLIASVVCLTVSFANVLVNVITNGEERGLMCLTMCTGDVTVSDAYVFFCNRTDAPKSRSM
ncbi:hypothetical protein BCR43DRAFT_431467 [Syncephalastrum racemosum]|uniref:G-protein coupled receptors family 1 profile domain-containing protein n=1 Tax=Syncephalastrum racemosum TaxID=13706 RepID=A0A1X2HTD6_SYNRA|nr:hypothetical protein BCR43DRAFT_431467 [Syncephalastrum racemosum]